MLHQRSRTKINNKLPPIAVSNIRPKFKTIRMLTTTWHGIRSGRTKDVGRASTEDVAKDVELGAAAPKLE